MSLQVWLPLTGHLDNQGLSDITVTNNGATVDNSGKLGECYSFDTASSYLTIPESIMTSFTDECTVSFWLYVISWNTAYATYFQAGTGSSPWNNYVFGVLRNNQTSKLCFTITDSGNTSSQASYLTPDLSLNTWYHLTFVYKTGHCLIYVNGTLHQDYTTTIIPKFNAISKITVGTCNNISSYQSNCKINDVRIYDHALSPKEIKLLSQGLVCHYTLGDRPCDNILTNSTGYNGTTNWVGAISVATENDTPYFIAKRTDTTSTSRTFIYHTAITSYVSSWATGDKFTISGYYRVPSSETYDVTANLFIRWGSSSGTSDTGFSTPSPASVIKDTWIRFEYTYSVPSSYTSGSAVNFYLSAFSKGLSTVHWKYVKLEKGDKATAWCPNSADAEYSKMGYDNTTVYDCSGYNNHMLAVNAPTIASETARYSVSTHFNNGQYIIANENSNTGWLPTDSITVNLWTYITTWGNPISCTESGGWNFEDAGGSSGIRFPIYVKGVGYVYKNSGVATSGLLNGWHMLTGTFDKTESKIYIDGDLKGTATASTSNIIQYSSARLCISAEAQGTTPASSTMVGNISDVRIYATALSAEDIQQLYNAPVCVSNNGAMFTQGEFVET